MSANKLFFTGLLLLLTASVSLAQPPKPSPGNGSPGSVTLYSQAFVHLQRQLDGATHPVKDGSLHFQYTGEYHDGPLVFTIYDAQRNDVTPATAQLQKQYGDNRFDLPLPLLPKGVYLLEVSDEKSQVFYLRFEIIGK